jgi:hypothetical protein
MRTDSASAVQSRGTIGIGTSTWGPCAIMPIFIGFLLWAHFFQRIRAAFNGFDGQLMARMCIPNRDVQRQHDSIDSIDSLDTLLPYPRYRYRRQEKGNPNPHYPLAESAESM